jgi:glyoxylase-like metal-dependent hydrolase (beta-lactamase superfamily II)
LSTRSKAEDAPDSPDESLAGHAYTHRGLTYPLGRTGPEPGGLIPLADGIGWTRSPVPGSLGHINLWLLDDDDGAVTIVDSGLDIAPAREAWEALLGGPRGGGPARRGRGTP